MSQPGPRSSFSKLRQNGATIAPLSGCASGKLAAAALVTPWVARLIDCLTASQVVPLAAALVTALVTTLAAALLPTAVTAAGLASFAARLAGFLGGELMGLAALVRSLAPFAGNFPLALRVHRGETSLGLAAALVVAPVISLVLGTLVALISLISLISLIPLIAGSH